jgi:hypothetical protein
MKKLYLVQKLPFIVEKQHSVVRPQGLETAKNGLGFDGEMRMQTFEDFLWHAEADLDVLVDANVDDP